MSNMYWRQALITVGVMVVATFAARSFPAIRGVIG